MGKGALLNCQCKARKCGEKAEKKHFEEYICIGIQRKSCAIAETLNHAKSSADELQEFSKTGWRKAHWFFVMY